MSGRPVYTDKDKARAFALLETNGGNVKRTARDLGMPISTLRRWRDEWDKDRMVPAAEDIVLAANDFLEDAERVRDLSLTVIRARARWHRWPPSSESSRTRSTAHEVLQTE